jgi:hypothetical protein
MSPSEIRVYADRHTLEAYDNYLAAQRNVALMVTESTLETPLLLSAFGDWRVSNESWI